MMKLVTIEIQIEEDSLIEDEIDLNDSQLIGLNYNYAEAQSSLSNACDVINQARGTIGKLNNSQKFNNNISKNTSNQNSNTQNISDQILESKELLVK